MNKRNYIYTIVYGSLTQKSPQRGVQEHRSDASPLPLEL
jgi:hypothetical protein